MLKRHKTWWSHTCESKPTTKIACTTTNTTASHATNTSQPSPQ